MMKSRLLCFNEIWLYKTCDWINSYYFFIKITWFFFWDKDIFKAHIITKTDKNMWNLWIFTSTLSLIVLLIKLQIFLLLRYEKPTLESEQYIIWEWICHMTWHDYADNINIRPGNNKLSLYTVYVHYFG